MVVRTEFHFEFSLVFSRFSSIFSPALTRHGPSSAAEQLSEVVRQANRTPFAAHLFEARTRNWRNPRTCLICPKIGSIIPLYGVRFPPLFRPQLAAHPLS